MESCSMIGVRSIFKKLPSPISWAGNSWMADEIQTEPTKSMYHTSVVADELWLWIFWVSV